MGKDLRCCGIFYTIISIVRSKHDFCKRDQEKNFLQKTVSCALMIKNLEGKVAVITGAAQGIGKSLAWSFVRHGMRVVLADINQQALEELEQELREISKQVLVKVTDVSDRI
jgi:FlaA1/EpsC-like NDP-sugar epimerase